MNESDTQGAVDAVLPASAREPSPMSGPAITAMAASTMADLRSTAVSSGRPLKIVHIHRPAISIRSGSMLVAGEEWPDGSLEIMLDDFVAVRVNYDHQFTDNVSVRTLADHIKVLLEGGKAVQS